MVFCAGKFIQVPKWKFPINKAQSGGVPSCNAPPQLIRDDFNSENERIMNNLVILTIFICKFFISCQLWSGNKSNNAASCSLESSSLYCIEKEPSPRGSIKRNLLYQSVYVRTSTDRDMYGVNGSALTFESSFSFSLFFIGEDRLLLPLSGKKETEKERKRKKTEKEKEKSSHGRRERSASLSFSLCVSSPAKQFQSRKRSPPSKKLFLLLLRCSFPIGLRGHNRQPSKLA